MPNCDQCGQRIEFRYVNGRLTPIHPYGGCGVLYDVRDHYRTHASDNRCWRTVCQRCQKPVYFIRHNGGSVWIDPPLGPPWDKHGCFYESEPAATPRTLGEETKLGTSLPPSSLIAVVTRVEVHPRGLETILHLQFPDGGERAILVHGEVDLSGEMVILDDMVKKVRFWKSRDVHDYTGR